MSVLILSLLGAAVEAAVPPVRVAVAANFLTTAEEISQKFEETTQVKVELVSGASGKLAAQIENEAPFDVFLSANPFYVDMLQDSGKVIKETRTEYALGRLALVSSDAKEQQDWQEAVVTCEKVAIPNPSHAPYGHAAIKALKKAAIDVNDRIVRGESSGQAMSFLVSSAADCAMISLAQVKDMPYIWPISFSYHQPLLQIGAVVSKSRNQVAAYQFLQFLQTKEIRQMIREAGYDLP